MQKEPANQKIITFLFFGAVVVLYVLFPSHNNSGDAWSMAADVKFGNELFSPHHLLYTTTVYVFEKVTHIQNILWLGILCNSVFALLTLIVLIRILSLLSSNWIKNLFLTAAVAFSFGFWRFATENETYIIPIFFSLLGSYYFIKYIKLQSYASKYIILSGLFATIACLYHQIHVFWFIGLFFGWIFMADKGGIKRGLLLASTFLFAPLSYFLVIIFYMHQSLNWFNVTHFVFHDYYIGSAGNHFGINDILLGGINIIRTFFQVHGQMRLMISNNLIWLLPGILALGMILFATVQIFRSRELTIRSRSELSNLNIIIKVHILIFVLQLIFAIYNIGNAEFMVMLPVLAAIILADSKLIPLNSIVFVSLSLLIWNFFYGILPNNRFHFNADDKVTQFIIDHPKDKFVVAQPAVVLNMYYYQKGHWPENCWAGPGLYELHGTLDELGNKIDSALLKCNVYTDCDGIPRITSRESMTYQQGMFWIMGYPYHDIVASYKTDAGPHKIFKIKQDSIHGKKGL